MFGKKKSSRDDELWRNIEFLRETLGEHVPFHLLLRENGRGHIVMDYPEHDRTLREFFLRFGAFESYEEAVINTYQLASRVAEEMSARRVAAARIRNDRNKK